MTALHDAVRRASRFYVRSSLCPTCLGTGMLQVEGLGPQVCPQCGGGGEHVWMLKVSQGAYLDEGHDPATH